MAIIELFPMPAAPEPPDEGRRVPNFLQQVEVAQQTAPQLQAIATQVPLTRSGKPLFDLLEAPMPVAPPHGPAAVQPVVPAMPIARVESPVEAAKGPTPVPAAHLPTPLGPPVSLQPTAVGAGHPPEEAQARVGGQNSRAQTPDGPGEVTLGEIQAALPYAYLSGPAGTGKTTLARELLKSRDDAVLCATTGIAAVNLGDATTINTLLGYFNTQSLMEHYASGYLQMRLRALRRSGIRLIVLDEVSMLDADQLTILVQAIEELEQTRSYDQELGELTQVERDADTRLQLLLVGDFAQLSPVEGQFAFTSPEWKRFQTLKLTTIRRQGDQSFIQALQAVRRGQPQMALPTLQPCLVPQMDFTFNGATIVAKNDEVDRINGMRHAKLPGPEWTWKSLWTGEEKDIDKDWIKHIPKQVSLKKGALVMILANKHRPKLEEGDLHQGLIYANGDLATVIEQTPLGCKVFLHRTLEDVLVTPYTKEKKVATGKKNPRWDVVATVTYMPLRLAYATTVHKSQGLTLDQVQVSIVNGMFAKGGMLYVALSRCRSLEGLRIVGNAKMFAGRCNSDPKIKDWI